MTITARRYDRLMLTTALCAGVVLCPLGAVSAQEAKKTDKQDLLVLDEVVLTAAPGTTTEGTDSWTTEWMRSATGMVLTQRETPQSTSAITDAQIKDRNITTIEKTMDAATGVTVLAYESDRISYFARGFAIDAYQYDGVPAPVTSVWRFGDNNPDMALYDHVEIVRGATGLMQGAGEPGASINFIRKRPTDMRHSEVAVGLSNPQGARVEADISGALNATGTVRGRLIGVLDKRDGSLDRYSKKKQVLFGALDVDIDENTLLSTSLTWQRTNANGVTWGGLPPFYADGGLIDWPKGASLGRDWTRVDTERTEFAASLEHVFGNGWTGRLAYTYVRNDLDTTLAWISGAPDRVTGVGMAGYGTAYDGGHRQHNLNAILNGDFNAFGRSHQFVAGAMLSKSKGAYYGYGQGAKFPVNLHDLGVKVPAPVLSSTHSYLDQDKVLQYALYGSARFNVTDQLNVLAGARINWWDGSKNDIRGRVADYKFSAEVTPYLGFTYDLSPEYTVYGSVTSIYKPQLVQDKNRQYLPATYGYNYELGIKGEAQNGALQMSAAVFQTNQKDVAKYVEWIPTENRSVYTSIDGITTRGFEVEAAGQITDRWNVSAGYTYRQSKDKDGNKVRADQPQHTLKIATDYRVAGFGDRLTLGGAMRWQSGTDSIEFVEVGKKPNVHQASYGVFDFNANYDIDDNTSLTLSVNNVLDKKYYATTGFFNTVVYGQPRSAELILRKKF